ncbi:hypothetical protein OAH77_04505 [Flavobacteriaceae bacterium]|nr:hypothetical protein [Flavobacteriaceae bacterium]
MANSVIEWNVAQQIPAERFQNQKEAQQEYLESSKEMMDASDLQYYIGETGKPLSWLIENGEDLSPLLTQPLNDGHTLDELMHVDVSTTDYDEVDIAMSKIWRKCFGY